MLYNVPILCGVELSPQEIMMLAKEDVIHSVKWSHAQVSRIHDTRLLYGASFPVLVGIDLVALGGLAAGADGYIGGVPMMAPRLPGSSSKPSVPPGIWPVRDQSGAVCCR